MQPHDKKQSASTEYWAAKPLAEIAKEIEAKFDEYRQWAHDTGYFDRIQRAYNAFYGFDNLGTLHITRDKNETAHMNVNHYKSLVKRIHLLVTENKLAYEPRAKTSDTKSQIEADLAKGICEYYGDEKNMNGVISECVLGSLIMLEQYVHCPWDLAEGYELTVDGQQVMKSGDQMFEVMDPFNVAKNGASAKSSWYIVRQKINKYDAAALNPLFANEILADSIEQDVYGLNGRQTQNSLTLRSEDDDDFVHKYILYHDRTPAMPYGRRTEIIAGQVLDDGHLLYEKVPVVRMSAGEVLRTPFGDSPAIDLLPLQQALNSLFSGTVTNNLNNSIQLIYSADPNLVTRKLADGQTLVSAAAEPKALNLTGSSAENFKMIDLLINNQQLLSGINDVARGRPGDSVTTAGGQALMIAQAIQYVSFIQKSYAYLASEVASCLINNIQKFATEEMTAYVAGISRKGQIKKFKSQDLMNVERITVDLGNPLTQSFAGRNELANAWMQKGVLKDPKQIVSFLATGNLDQGIEDQFSDAMLIRDENEMLKKGQTPTPVLTDNHSEHILSHKEVYSDPDVRNDPTIMNAAMQHIQAHIDLMRQVPPDLAAVLSGQPLPPPPPPPGAPGPANAPEPTVQGVHLPEPPNGTPLQTAANYQQATAQVPPDNQPMHKGFMK